MSHVKTDIGQIASIDTFNLKLAQTEVFSSLTFSRNEAVCKFAVLGALLEIEDQYTVPAIGGCRTYGCTEAPSVSRKHTECITNVIAANNYFRLSHLNAAQVDVRIKDQNNDFNT